MSSAHRTTRTSAVVGALFQTFVFTPLGTAAKFVTDPAGAVEQARQDLSTARFLGEMAVRKGASELRRHLADEPGGAAFGSEADPADVTTGAGPADDVDIEPLMDAASLATVPPEAMRSAEPVADGPEAHAVGVDEAEVLAIPDYDHLPAIDIVGQLESLTVDELAEVDAYERANRRRRTVLGKIAQLTDGS